MPKVKPKLKNSFKKLQKDEQLKNNRSRLHLPHLKPKATQTHIINNSISQPSFLYKPEHKILLIGEGNFSFAHSLIENVLPAAHSIIATSYDSEQIVYEKYKDSKEHIDSIKFFGLGIKDQDRNILSNQNLIKSFFNSSIPFLTSQLLYSDDSNGEIHITIKSGLPYDDWNVKKLAKSTGLLLVKTTMSFSPDNYPGYVHRRTLGYKDGQTADPPERTPCTFLNITTNKIYNLNPLTKSSGDDWIVEGYDTGYTFRINICHELLYDVGTKVGIWGEKENERGGDKVILKYKYGNYCPGDNAKRSSLISFTCDQSVNGIGSPTFVDTDDCTYFFEWRTPVACPTDVTNATMSGLGVFFTIFIIALIVYLIGGIVYNRMDMFLSLFVQCSIFKPKHSRRSYTNLPGDESNVLISDDFEEH
ncbi:15298_t:CDS:2 [Entrophospora sp. SA101]|nr:15298_t:CDS:2 [Entrophospora sp. SA101]